MLAVSNRVSEEDKLRAEAVMKARHGRLLPDDALVPQSQEALEVWPPFTHLLCPPHKLNKSLKTLLALAAGRLLVTPAWVDACRCGACAH